MRLLAHSKCNFRGREVNESMLFTSKGLQICKPQVKGDFSSFCGRYGSHYRIPRLTHLSGVQYSPEMLYFPSSFPGKTIQVGSDLAMAVIK